MTQKVIPFLTFNGKTEEMMNFYADVFPDSKIIAAVPYGDMAPNDFEKKLIFHGEMEIMGMTFQFMDNASNLEEAPAINWATSYYIDCANQAEFDAIFEKLSVGADVSMGPEPVPEGDMRMAASLTDKYGITWQLIFK